MVFHDQTLERLTGGAGRLDATTSSELKRVPFRSTDDRMITVGELCDLVAGRVTLVIELKSRFEGNVRLAARAASVLSAYQGPVALMSFDPAQMTALRALAPALTRGIVAESRRPTKGERFSLLRMFSYARETQRSRPQFIAYSVQDLPAALPHAARAILGMPLLTWTVRTDADLARARRYADQIIFEQLRP
jgi:glycerophosphoryl diester phosphodiesterase